jgi:hypothetical protein
LIDSDILGPSRYYGGAGDELGVAGICELELARPVLDCAG